MVLEEQTNQRSWLDFLSTTQFFPRCGGRPDKCKAARWSGSRKKSTTPPHQLAKGSSIIGLNELERDALPACMVAAYPPIDQPVLQINASPHRASSAAVCAHCHTAITGTVFMGRDRAFCSTPRCHTTNRQSPSPLPDTSALAFPIHAALAALAAQVKVIARRQRAPADAAITRQGVAPRPRLSCSVFCCAVCGPHFFPRRWAASSRPARMPCGKNVRTEGRESRMRCVFSSHSSVALAGSQACRGPADNRVWLCNLVNVDFPKRVSRDAHQNRDELGSWGLRRRDAPWITHRHAMAKMRARRISNTRAPKLDGVSHMWLFERSTAAPKDQN